MPPNEVRADPVELSRLAGTTLTASQQIADAWSTALGSITLSRAAFGDIPDAAARELSEQYQFVTEQAGLIVEDLAAVHEHDTDALYRLAFAYQQADRKAAERLRQQHRNIPL
jgi:hypothetical protein